MYVEPTNADVVNCPYIKGEKFRQRYTVLKELTSNDFDHLLINGWRHFGYYFFMPNCSNCSSCTPIRTVIEEFKPSKSQRRNLKKNINTTVEIQDLIYSDEIYEIYKKHSHDKFNQDSSKKDFKESFFADALSGNSKLSLYKVDSKLVGVGFIDISNEGISSIYFCYDTDFSHLGLGVYSVLKEIEYANELGKSYYYLGYYIEGNGSMEYKAKYKPYETLSWDRACWIPFKELSIV